MFSVGDRIEKTSEEQSIVGGVPIGSLATVREHSNSATRVQYDDGREVYYFTSYIEQHFSLYTAPQSQGATGLGAWLPATSVFAPAPGYPVGHGFKLGDRVRAASAETAPRGTLGTVQRIERDSIAIQWDPPDSGYTYIAGDINAHIEMYVPDTKRSASAGLICSGPCGEFYPYAEPNQPDGSLKCYGCRH